MKGVSESGYFANYPWQAFSSPWFFKNIQKVVKPDPKSGSSRENCHAYPPLKVAPSQTQTDGKGKEETAPTDRKTKPPYLITKLSESRSICVVGISGHIVNKGQSLGAVASGPVGEELVEQTLVSSCGELKKHVQL